MQGNAVERLMRAARGEVSITRLESALYRHFGVEVAMLRIDQLHPQISGNKWFKLLPLLRRLEAGEKPKVISFGGVWSNHLHALAYVGRYYGVETLAMVRGHPSQPLTDMLADAQAWGMQIEYLDRKQYRERAAPEFLAMLSQQYPGWQILPEGGSCADAVEGCRTIWDLLDDEWSTPDLLACAMGTGGTLAGLIAGKPASTRLLGIPVLELGDEAERMVRALLQQANVADPLGWSLDREGAFGGYAKLTPELSALLHRFEQLNSIPLDPIYTLKLVAAVNRRIARGEVARGDRVLLLHSGGLQGRRGMASRLAGGASAFVGPLLV